MVKRSDISDEMLPEVSSFFGPTRSGPVVKHGAVFLIKRKEVFTENKCTGCAQQRRETTSNIRARAQSSPLRAHPVPCPPGASRPELPTDPIVDGALSLELAVRGGRASVRAWRWLQRTGLTQVPMGRQVIHLPELSG